MLLDLVAHASLRERYGPRAASLGPFRDFADLEFPGLDPRSLRAQARASEPRVVRRRKPLGAEPTDDDPEGRPERFGIVPE